MNKKHIGYIAGGAIAAIGLAGMFVSPCGYTSCCQSFFAQLIGSNKCAAFSYYGERPWSIELAILGIIVLVANRLLNK